MLRTYTNRHKTKLLLLNAAVIAALSVWGSPADARDVEKAVVYAQCMRANGFPDFPDPDAGGRILLRQRLDDRSAPALRTAHKACNDLAPEGWASERPDPERKAKLLGFAQCVRDEGIADFPDPSSEGQFDFATITDSPELKSAMETCRQAKGVIVGFGG
ncbi:hypothetical protein [Nitratireductor sp. ZSWI3]|uniref:hypothetical protein n=1 Tax=Nitratireductor sp. ZSWI3 TaxID=2966359 RepID=UPI00214FDA34|nr:hypothetical protein [Nitratireductor sp. ZSWI3]MCR4268557.1 hypothetical protein [Nitratireductor sp. ZSWI3]